MADPQLPEDVFIEILIRLPMKSIVKFRCVSKSWRDLIRSPIFIYRHQKRERKHSVLLVKSSPRQDNEDKVIFSFHAPDFPEFLVSPNLYLPVLKDVDIYPLSYARLQIYGPCNGLVCVPLEKFIFLCNPALREFKLLPPLNIACPEGYMACPSEFGFGFDPNTGAYKVIQISGIFPKEHGDLRYPYLKNNFRIDLYNSAYNSWKPIDAKVPLVTQLRSFEIFFKGVIHLYAAIHFPNDYPYILCFDISTEALKLLDFPDDFPKPGGAASLMVLDESLAMVRYPAWGMKPKPMEIDIWVMKEYGVKESWTKQFVIGPHMVICPFLFLNNEWLLVESNNGQLAVCALYENKIKRFPFDGSDCSLSAVVYEESLISLNDIISSD